MKMFFELIVLLFFFCVDSQGIYAQSNIPFQSTWTDISKADTRSDLADRVAYYIDESPFLDHTAVSQEVFSTLSSDILEDRWLEGAKYRFWLKINICNSGIQPIDDYKLYLGTADRVFLYQIVEDDVHLIVKKGLDYRDEVDKDFPFYFDFPLAIGVGDSVQYLAHISSTFIPESFESIQPLLVKQGHERHLYESSRKGRQLGLAYTATLSVVFVFFIIGLILYWGTRESSLLAFTLICLSFIIYYIRDLDVFVSSVEFLNIGDENLSRSEPLGRALINASFLLFTFSYFKQFKYRKFLKWGAIGVVIIGVISGLWTLFFNRVGPLIAYTIADQGLFLGYIVLSLLISILILGTLWFSVENYSKFYIVGTLFFITCNYSGLLVEGLSPSAELIPHFNNYASLLGVFMFTLAMVYMILQRILTNEKQVVLKTAEVKQLSDINQAKSEFYTNVTHEFRTPLTVILGMASSIKNSDVEKNLIIKNAKSLLSLVNQMLSLSKNQEYPDISKTRTTDIVNFVSSIIEPLKYHAAQKYLDIAITASPTELIMSFDPSGIQKVINNLVYNAIKFSPPHTKIDIELSHRDDRLKIIITDEGIGIEADQLPHIFERFYQSHPNISSASDIGSGIGLAIVKEHIEKMKGSITVDSEIGEGTSFTIIIPAVPVHVDHQDRDDVMLPLTIANSKAASIEESPTTILIIEDNEDVLLYTRRCLESSYHIITASDGKVGLSKATHGLPDLILSDVMMPKMNGFELTRSLKKDTRTDHIPIVLLTAKATQSEMIEGLTVGADDYIYKPFDQEELLLRVDNIIAGRRRTAEKNRLLSQQETIKLPEWLLQFETLITSNLDTAITSEWLSDQLQLSRSQIHRKMKSLTGLTPTQYIKQIKIKQAKTILLSSTDSIDMIAGQLGFKSVSYFSSSFKEINGVTPSQWRQSKHL